MYPEEMVQPMREELTSLGFQELQTPAEVDAPGLWLERIQLPDEDG